MESLLTKIYSRLKVGDAEAATSNSESNPGKAEIAMKPVAAIPRAIQCQEETLHPHSETPPIRSLDGSTDHDSSDSTQVHAPAFQPQSSRSLAQNTTVINLPPDNAVTLQCRGSQSELESGDTVTASKGPLMDQRSSPASGEPVIGQSINQRLSTNSDGDVSMSHKEMESFELLDISDFENDNSSESLPPSPLQTRPKSTSPTLSAESVATSSRAFQFNQSKFHDIMIKSM